MVFKQAKSETTIHDTNRLCQQYLTVLYDQIKNKSSTHVQNQASVNEKQGEITYSGIQKILSKIALHADDHFLDLGAGSGRAAIQVFLNSPVKEVTGIEISSSLQQQALLAAQKMKKELPQFYLNNRTLTFIQGNFFEKTWSFPTVILINSTCFGPEMMQKLSHIINKTPSIRFVFSLRPMPMLANLRLRKIFRVECSWDSSQCHLYQL